MRRPAQAQNPISRPKCYIRYPQTNSTFTGERDDHMADDEPKWGILARMGGAKRLGKNSLVSRTRNSHTAS
jgi:hypothetical protein